MTQAYVTVMTGAGASQDVVTELRDIPEVERADIVAGEFDIVAGIETESERDLLTLVTEEIQSISGVGRTSTCIVLD